MKELTDIFRETNSRLIRSMLDRGAVVLGIKATGFRNVLVEDKEYADALAKKLNTELGVKGYISTDELPAYGISKEERDQIEGRFDLASDDVVIMVVDQHDKAESALNLISEEIKKKEL